MRFVGERCSIPFRERMPLLDLMVCPALILSVHVGSNLDSLGNISKDFTKPNIVVCSVIVLGFFSLEAVL